MGWFRDRTRFHRTLRVAVSLAVGLCLLPNLPGTGADTHGPPSEIALQFDGAGAHVDIPDDFGIFDGQSDFTIEVWINPGDLPEEDSWGTAPVPLCFRAKNNLRLTFADGCSTPDRVGVRVELEEAGWSTPVESNRLSTDTWYHVGVTYSTSDGWALYQNGTRVAASPATERIGSEGGGNYIAGEPGQGNNKYFNGLMRGVRVWDRALDEAEIAAGMKTTLAGEEEGLMAYWPLDDGTGEIAKEMVAGKDGQIKGDYVWTLAHRFLGDIRGRTVEPGDTVTLGPIEVYDPVGEVSYQWYRDGHPIEGATESTLTVVGVTERDMGTYCVEVDDERAVTPVRSNQVLLAGPDWPMWQFDAARSANSPNVPAGELHLQWMRQLPEPKRAWRHQWDHRGKLDFDASYSPVVSGTLIFVPSSVTDSVTAYSIEDGARVWRFYVDGPVRLAPAVWGGKVYFVSDDGHLCCVDAESGELEWKFRGGPSDHRLLGNERIINTWPARGGPVVKDGTVYFAAGIWPLHGVFVYALDAGSGEVLWLNDTTSSEFVNLPHGGAVGYGGLAPQGYLAVSENRLVVAGGRTPPAFFNRQTGEFEGASFRAKPAGNYAVHALDGGGMGKQKNQMLEDCVESLANRIDGEVFCKLAARDRVFVTTEDGKLYCFGKQPVSPERYAYEPVPLRPRTGEWADVAADLLEQLGESEGYALMLGAGSGDLLRELLSRSELHVVVAENDPAEVRALREDLVEAGMYGRRAAVVEADPAAFSVQPYLFSMVVCEDVESAGIVADADVLGPVLDRLRPYGGVAYLGASADAVRALHERAVEAMVDRVSVVACPDHLFARRGGPLSGAGQWTHQYHDAANTLFSRDQRVRLPLGLLWFGGPSNHNILPRHAGGPRPQVAGGREVFLGVETIGARCVYTGRQLWEQEFPGIGHPFTNLDLEERWRGGHQVYMSNIPGVTYIGSPFVTLRDGVYLRYKGSVYRLDPATGQTMAEFRPPGRSVELIYGDEDVPEWGHISASGDYLIVTSEPHVFEDQELGWSNSYSGTSSRLISVMDRHTGEVFWQRRAEVGFRHGAIVSSEDTLYVIDGLSENALEHLARRGERPENASRILALDLHSGQERWSSDSEVFGTFLLYSTEHDILIEGGSRDMRSPFEDEPRRMTARRGADGEILWQRGGDFTLPGAIRGDMLIPGRPGTARSLLTGEDWQRVQQHTGQRSGWRYSRAYGCNTLNASENLLFYRSGYAGFFDLEHDSGTGTFGGFKSGCTANMLAVDGIMVALDYTRTCTCSYAHQTSLAMIHMPDDPNIECWTRYDGSPPDPAGHGINFGAPGRRVDVGGTGLIWYHEDGELRRHPSAVTAGEGIPWVAASAREVNGDTIVEDLIDTTYTVRLHFADLAQEVKAGQRVFDVIINGEKVLENFDIVADTGAPLRCTVRELSVDVDEGSMTVHLRKAPKSELDPLINGIELVARGIQRSQLRRMNGASGSALRDPEKLCSQTTP